MSLSFSFYSYCISPSILIQNIIQSKISSISINTIHDIIPTIVKTKKYYNILKYYKFIKCSAKDNIKSQILEMNYIIYNKYLIFHKNHLIIANKYITKYSIFKKIGLHVRLNDDYLNKYKNCTNQIIQIEKIVSNISKDNIYYMLSSFNKNFSKEFINRNKNTFAFNQNIDIKHIALSHDINQKDIEKIVMDIHLVSQSDVLLISGYSTFSLIMLFKGYYNNYDKCFVKNYTFWNGGEIFDHLNRFRRYKKCKNITLPKL